MHLLTLVFLAACAPTEPSPADDHRDTSATADTGVTPDPRLEAVAVAVASDLENNLATGASVAVWLDGEVLWVGGFGSAHPDRDQPVGSDTLFMIGSDTKKLTAISLLQRIAEGSAALDTTVAEVVPELDMAWAPSFTSATVHDLLSHQGGIVDMLEENTRSEGAGLEAFTLGEFAEQAYPLAPPGRIWNYANPNFSIAGLLDQRLSGVPWEDQIQASVLAPLGMTRTVTTLAGVDDDAAAGFGLADFTSEIFGSVEVEDSWESAWTRPAGLLWSNSLDQVRLAAFLVDGNDSVLPTELHAKMHAPHVEQYPGTTTLAYGYGLMIDQGLMVGDDWYDVAVWSHGGNTITHTSAFTILPTQRFAISVLSNGYGDDFSGTVDAAIQALVADLPTPTTAPALPFDPATLDGLAGTYVDPFSLGDLVITRVGDGLTVEAPTLDDYDVPYDGELRPLATRWWLWSIQGTYYDIAFVDGPDGETYLRNRNFVAIRGAETPSGPQRPQARPRLDGLDALVPLPSSQRKRAATISP